MKVQYRTTLDVNDKPCKFDEKRVSLMCCDKMKRFYGEEEIFNFGGGGPFVSLIEHEFGWYGDHDRNYHPIKFCPFCGEEIICEEVELVKIVETKTPKTKTVTQYETTRTEEVVWKKSSEMET